jgi:phenylacetate-CoA ligase
MEKITGRCDDMMIVRGVNVFPSQIEELILKHAALSPHYQCVLGKEGPLDTLTVRVEAALGASADVANAASAHLAHEIKSMIGVTAAIEILATGGIERSVGKARRVVDLRR